MKTHAQEGHTILSRSHIRVHALGALIARDHHERWDGTGYPQGLSGETISIEGRIAAIADVFDSLVTTSCYKEAWPLQEAFAYVSTQSGKQFDPNLIALLNANMLAIEKFYPN
jgi:response regulator RpfG family c-di-GMP phosphodiesterase